MKELEATLADILRDMKETADTFIRMSEERIESYKRLNAELDEIIRKMKEQYE